MNPAARLRGVPGIKNTCAVVIRAASTSPPHQVWPKVSRIPLMTSRVLESFRVNEMNSRIAMTKKAKMAARRANRLSFIIFKVLSARRTSSLLCALGGLACAAFWNELDSQMLTNLVGSLFVLFGLVLGTPTPCTYGGVPTRNNGFRLGAWLENAVNGNFYDVQLSQSEAIPSSATVMYFLVLTL